MIKLIKKLFDRWLIWVIFVDIKKFIYIRLPKEKEIEWNKREKKNELNTYDMTINVLVVLCVCL